MLSGNLKLGNVPRGVAVGGALSRAVLDVVGGRVAQDIDWELNCKEDEMRPRGLEARFGWTFEELAVLVPVNHGLEGEVGRGGVEGDRLHNGGSG